MIPVYTDAPIKSAEEDVLGRDVFAGRLARVLCSDFGDESIAVGLYGPWGSGKTSVVNLLKYRLELDDSVKATVVFEPWNYTDEKQLLAQFFQALEKGLRGNDKSSSPSDLVSSLASYGEAILASGVLTSYLPSDNAALEIGGLAGIAVGKEFLRQVSAKLTSRASDISGKKERLSKELEKLDGRVIVIIDDVDRLSNEQIRMLFQLVASLAKLPKINYLLSFDEEVVSRALGVVQNCDGNAYLEKVIQVPVRLPLAAEADMDGILFTSLGEACAEYGLGEGDLDQEKWSSILSVFLRNRFSTIREVKRFVNALRVRLNAYSKNLSFEDMVAIAMLEVRYPAFCDWIIENKDRLCGRTGSALALGGPTQDQKKTQLEDELKARVPQMDPYWGVAALCTLFPRVVNETGLIQHGRSSGPDVNGVWRSDKFDLYFYSKMPEAMDPRDISKVLNLADVAEIEGVFEKNAANGSFIQLIEGIREEFMLHGVRNAQPLSEAILGSFGRYHESVCMPLFSTDSDEELVRLLESCLLILGETSSVELLSRSFVSCDERVAYPLSLLLGWMVNSKEKKVISDEGLESLKEDFLLFAKSASRDAVLFAKEEAKNCLALWKQLDPDSYWNYATATATNSSRDVPWVLLFEAKRFTLLGSKSISSLSFNIEEIDEKIGNSSLIKAIESIVNDEVIFELPEDAQIAAASFIRACDDGRSAHVERDEALGVIDAWRIDKSPR